MKKVISVVLAVTVICASLVFSPISVHAGSVIETAISWALAIADDDTHGYSQLQNRRWGNPDYDCSSFVITAFANAGCNVEGATYTGNMRSVFENAGFTWIPKSQIDLSNSSQLVRGDILLNEAKHTEIYIGNNQRVGAHTGTYDKYDSNSPGDNNGIEISIYNYSNSSNWDGILRYNDEPIGHDPTGVLDSADGGVGTVHLRGWAFDEDDTNARLNIHVYIGGPSGDANAEGHNQTWANQARGDVDSVYGCGVNHGFDDTIPTTKTGNVEVYVYAINIGGGSNVEIGHQTVYVSPDTEKPVVENKYFDQVKSDGFWPCFTVKDNVGIRSVRVATWTRSDQSDLIWHDATNNGYGTYFVDVKRLDYSSTQNSIYHNHAYIYDYSGNVVFAGIDMDYRIKSDTGKNIPEGEYRIATAVNNDKYLDIAGGSTSSGANIQIYANAISPLQTFNLTYNNNGFYKIANTHSNCLVDVVGDTYLNNTNVAQSTENGGANQEWMFKPTDDNDGYYYIIARSNGLALDVTNALDQDGANVAVHAQNQSKAQKWKLRRVLKDDMVTITGWTFANGFYQPDAVVTVDDKVLTENIDYNVSTYIENETLYANITGLGDFCDSISVKFQESFVLGDVDGDDEVNAYDVTFIQRYIADMSVKSFDEQAADADGDGDVTAFDVTYIQRYLAGFETPYSIGEKVAKQ